MDRVALLGTGSLRPCPVTSSQAQPRSDSPDGLRWLIGYVPRVWTTSLDRTICWAPEGRFAN